MKRVMKHFKVTFLFLNKLVNYIETLQLFVLLYLSDFHGKGHDY